MTMNRSSSISLTIQEAAAEINLTMANCLVLLSQQPNSNHHTRTSLFLPSYDAVNVGDRSSPSRVFECKTCNRQFPSFQALGGHRASHKKPRLTLDGSSGQMMMMSPAKPKTHECSICGLEFAIGQALGGHMRRHRASRVVAPTTTSEEKDESSPSTMTDEEEEEEEAPPRKKARVLMSLDLNLTPFENDVKMFNLGKAAPLVHYFY